MGFDPPSMVMLVVSPAALGQDRQGEGRKKLNEKWCFWGKKVEDKMFLTGGFLTNRIHEKRTTRVTEGSADF